MFDAPSRAIGRKASSNKSAILISGTAMRSYITSSSLFSCLTEFQIENNLMWLLMIWIAVPGSFTAGDNALLAISLKVIIPKRGSVSK